MLQLGLIGYPLGHSLSPQLHQAALDAMGLPGSYSLYPVPPDEKGQKNLHNLCAALRSRDIQGLNVTIPHKRTVLQFVDFLTPTARAAGAVNTLFMDGEQLCADNTDAPGFLADLAEQTGWPAGRPVQIEKAIAWVLGAGGSARAVAFSLAQAGWKVIVTARRISQAQELVDALAPYVGEDLLALQQLSGEMIMRREDNPHLLVNTTPLGMHPREAFSPWPKGVPFPENALVYDLVYNPAQTVLVREAVRSGLSAVNGLGMLVEQAALSLERWTGCTVPRSAMWSAIQQLSTTIDQDVS